MLKCEFAPLQNSPALKKKKCLVGAVLRLALFCISTLLFFFFFNVHRCKISQDQNKLHIRTAVN